MLEKASIAQILTALGISENTYTPTATGTANYDGNFNVVYAKYTRVLNEVTVRIQATVGATSSATYTEIEINNPITSAMTLQAHLSGQGLLSLLSGDEIVEPVPSTPVP